MTEKKTKIAGVQKPAGKPETEQQGQRTKILLELVDISVRVGDKNGADDLLDALGMAQRENAT